MAASHLPGDLQLSSSSSEEEDLNISQLIRNLSTDLKESSPALIVSILDTQEVRFRIWWCLPSYFGSPLLLTQWFLPRSETYWKTTIIRKWIRAAQRSSAWSLALPLAGASWQNATDRTV